MSRAVERWHARPAWYRAGYGALLAVGALGLPILLLAGIAAFGGRFQWWRRSGSEWDTWLLAAVYPVGIAIAGAIAGLSSRWIRRGWQAGIAGFVAGLPAFLLMGLAVDPHDATPYSLGPREWTLAIVCALALGVPVGIGIFRAGPKRWRQKKGNRRPPT